ncbi:unnamed protein product [Arctia plantaginis]|uniref:Uncharacterized protein n=1 Tax=Arctia plantaginis TaxID=874455 RepID=A0A8S0Z6P6_ARCPL|nr:unnamed protein product [Arctia plantaginis]
MVKYRCGNVRSDVIQQRLFAEKDIYLIIDIRRGRVTSGGIRGRGKGCGTGGRTWTGSGVKGGGRGSRHCFELSGIGATRSSHGGWAMKRPTYTASRGQEEWREL